MWLDCCGVEGGDRGKAHQRRAREVDLSKRGGVGIVGLGKRGRRR